MKDLNDFVLEKLKLNKQSISTNDVYKTVHDVYKYIVNKYKLNSINDCLNENTCPEKIDLTDIYVDFPKNFQLATDNNGHSVGLFEGFKCEEIDISSWSINDLNQFTFAYCRKLKTIHLPKKLKSLSWGIFYFCKNIENIELPSTLTGAVESLAFYGIDNLNELNIPEGITSIKPLVFCNSTIKTLILPKSLKTISKNTFKDISNLSELEIKTPKGNKEKLANILIKAKYDELAKNIKEI